MLYPWSAKLNPHSEYYDEEAHIQFLIEELSSGTINEDDVPEDLRDEVLKGSRQFADYADNLYHESLEA